LEQFCLFSENLVNLVNLIYRDGFLHQIFGVDQVRLGNHLSRKCVIGEINAGSKGKNA